jgi:hypothetical protein
MDSIWPPSSQNATREKAVVQDPNFPKRCSYRVVDASVRDIGSGQSLAMTAWARVFSITLI